MSTSKDKSGHKMCPLGVKLISSIRKFHFSSSGYFSFSSKLHKYLVCHHVFDRIRVGKMLMFATL